PSPEKTDARPAVFFAAYDPTNPEQRAAVRKDIDEQIDHLEELWEDRLKRRRQRRYGRQEHKAQSGEAFDNLRRNIDHVLPPEPQKSDAPPPVLPTPRAQPQGEMAVVGMTDEGDDGPAAPVGGAWPTEPPSRDAIPPPPLNDGDRETSEGEGDIAPETGG